MKVVAISSIEGAAELLRESEAQGYLTFIYHHADPEHKLLRDKFLYVDSDQELVEKIMLLKKDVTILHQMKRS